MVWLWPPCGALEALAVMRIDPRSARAFGDRCVWIRTIDILQARNWNEEFVFRFS